MSKIETESIERRLKHAENYDVFYKENATLLRLYNAGEYLNYLLNEKDMKKTELISKVNMNTGYVYEILRDEKKPDRNKMLQFAFALRLNIDEAQEMLKKCGYAMLYCKSPRDSVIIFCLSRKKKLVDASVLLHKYGYEGL